MITVDEYLKKIDEVIEQGKYKDTWDSLKDIKIPEWFSKGKFGLFIHWGCFTVPESASEWYPRWMYFPGTKAYKHKNATYGKDTDYREIAEKFNPKKFNAQEWLDIFVESGAKHIMPVGEHHDGIKLYQSDLNRWNTTEMAPKTDFMAELHKECDNRGVRFLISNHRAEHFWFMNGARKFAPNSEALNAEFKDLYGDLAVTKNGGTLNNPAIVPTEEWMKDWLASACEMVDKNKPTGMYFDWWVEQLPFRPYLKKFLAYYYNRALSWNIEPVVFYKYNAIMQGCAIFDVERGQIDTIAQKPWQCDTSIAKNSWSYTANNKFKTTHECLTNLIDVVSKNGCLMLNVGPRADGSICEEEKKVLKEIGQWLKINGEAIYSAEPYTKYGEGKRTGTGAFNENIKYSSKDYRFTYKNGALYVFPLSNRKRNVFCIKSLRKNKNKGMTYKVKNISILGRDTEIEWSQNIFQFKITTKEMIKSELPICFKIEID